MTAGGPRCRRCSQTVAPGSGALAVTRIRPAPVCTFVVCGGRCAVEEIAAAEFSLVSAYVDDELVPRPHQPAATDANPAGEGRLN